MQIWNQVQDNVKIAYLLDKFSGDTKWVNTITKKMQQIDKFEVFMALS